MTLPRTHSKPRRNSFSPEVYRTLHEVDAEATRQYEESVSYLTPDQLQKYWKPVTYKTYFTPDQRLVPKLLQVQTLRWVNQVRERYGREPLTTLPKGIPFNCFLNPVSLATGLVVGQVWYGPEHHTMEWDMTMWVPGYHSKDYPTPKFVARFLSWFDWKDGDYHHPEERPSGK